MIRFTPFSILKVDMSTGFDSNFKKKTHEGNRKFDHHNHPRFTRPCWIPLGLSHCCPFGTASYPEICRSLASREPCAPECEADMLKKPMGGEFKAGRKSEKTLQSWLTIQEIVLSYVSIKYFGADEISNTIQKSKTSIYIPT